jgi:methionine-rich copper-binding protein CopC
MRNVFSLLNKAVWSVRASMLRPSRTAESCVVESLEQRRLLASIASVSPANGGFGVAPDAHLQVTFASAMNTATITSSTYELFDSNNNLVAARLSYNADDNTATLDASNPLAYDSTYTLEVIGGSGGVKDSSGGQLASSMVWSFTTQASPVTGPGGPVMVITNSTDQFSSYYPEILKAEGINEFATADISTLSASLLAGEQTVVLGEVSLTAAQVSALTTWVNAGGKLIAMRPDTQLDSLLGIESAGGTMSEAYLQISNSTVYGAGLTNTTIQYHGTADLYTLNGATALAMLYSDATTATDNPAVTINNVGTNGGQAVAFTFDLAQSIVETRQGNPAWAGQERDGNPVDRSDDLFFGDSATDTETNWNDLNKVNIPQADEEQRLFSNIIEEMQLAAAPLPRFWYFPDSAPSLLIMTGDDHDTGGTIPRWEGYVADGSIDGIPITASSYIFPGSANTNAALEQYQAEGFDPALHIDIDPGLVFGNSSDEPVNWTSESELESIYQNQLATFESTYPSLPSPTTERTHGIVWSDYTTQPEVEFSNGIRIDDNYYYWPSTFTNDHPGMFTGSGIPMLFATSSGQTINVFQESTVMTDESGLTPQYNIDALLNAATGPQGFYGAFGIQAHTDAGNTAAETESADVIAAAQAYGVPVISSADLLDFEDGRDGSYFSGNTWNASTGKLTFNISLAQQSNGLTTMVPLVAANGANVSSISINGTSVSFTKQLIAGIYYAFFQAANGTVTVQYTANATPLSVTPGTPASGAINVATNSTVTATFNEAIDPSTLSFNLMDNNGNVVPSTVSYNSTTHVATLTPSEVLRGGFTYTATINALDSSDHATAPLAWSFTTAAPVVSDSTIYSLWGGTVTPTLSTDDSAIEVGTQFSTDVNGYVTAISFYKGANNTGTHIGNLWTADGTLLATGTFTNETASGWQTLTFSSPVPIIAGQVYVASYHTNTGFYAATPGYFATTGADDGPLHAPPSGLVLGGNGVETDSATSTFPSATNDNTNYWVDVSFHAGTVTIPTVTARTPTPQSTDVSASTTVSATFNEAIQIATLSFVLNDSNGNSITGTVTYNSSTDTATFTPSEPLLPYTQYTATVSGAKDALGNTMIMPWNWSFTTAPAIAGTVNLFGNEVPGNTGTPDPTAIEVGMKFESTVAGQILGIRFYKEANNTGVHTGSLWSSTGTLLATGTFTDESATGWQTLTFATPVTIQANTVYVASYHTTVGYYAADYYYFNDGGASSSPLIALQSGVDGQNGVFAEGNGGIFPTDSYESTNYWVDVNFLPSTSTSPTVTAVSPPDGSTGVSTGTAVTLSFNESLNPATITSSTVQLLGPSNTTVAATLAYVAGSTSLTLTPTAPLASNTTYTIDATTGITDNNGNALTAPFTSSFTTAAPAGTNLTIWSNGTTPGTVTVDDPNAVELGVKFESSVAGTITGIRFYKGPDNTGTHVGNLWSSTGQLLATATFTGESETGWQQVNFATPVTIQANTVYVASYHTNVGFYSADANYFATSGFSNGPLTALSNAATSGGNGVFAYGATSTFPTNTYESTNYYVDVVFTPSTAPLTPTVVSETPANGATGVLTGTTVTATFNEAVSPTSIVFSLTGPGSTAVTTNLSYNSTTNVATWTPTAALAAGTIYTATVTDANDSNGNSMTAPVSWSFTTAPAVIPTVVSNTPANGATAVSKSTTVSATFNEGVNSSSIVFSLTGPGDTTVATTLSYNSATNTATWTLTAVLAASTLYTATVTNATDSNGDTMSAPVTWSFTTAAATVPTVVSETPAPNAVAITTATTITATFSEAVSASSIVFGLTAPGAATVATTMSYNSTTDTATWIPTAALAAGTTYTATITNATDTGGNNMAAPVSWSFTTAAVSDTIFANATPSNVSEQDANAVELGLKFESSVAGYVTGVRFYKGAQNIGTHVGNLWSSTGTLLATVTFTGETASGWQQENFSAPVAIQANTIYVISYHTNAGFYSADANYFTSSGVTAGPLTALSNAATSGGNGVFAYGSTSSFPTNTYESTNYYVDVDFTPAPTNPAVTAESPLANATGVSTGATVSATFNEPVTSSSIVFSLTGPGNSSVATTLSYNSTTNVATWTPTTTLATNTTYTAAITNATNSSGNSMSAPVTWTFTTAAPVIPTVTAETPISGATGVSTATTVTATFNEAVTSSSIVFALTNPSDATIATTLSYNSTTNVATWTPTAALAPNTTYTATITNATDGNGDTMSAPVTWTFTTGAVINSWTQTAASGFSSGTNSGTTVASGGVQLVSEFTDNFPGTALDSNWTTATWSGNGGGPLSDTVANNTLTLKGGQALSTAQTLSSFTAVGTFGAIANQIMGISTGSLLNDGNSGAIFDTFSTTTLEAIVAVNGTLTEASLGTTPTGSNTYSINPTSTGVQFLINGVVKTTINAVLPTTSKYSAVLSALSGASTSPALTVTSVTIGYPTTGTFTSSVFNSGKTATWGLASWTSTLPTGTSFEVLTRSGNTATPDGTWSAWQAVTNGGQIASPSAQYLQYEVIFTTTNQLDTALLQSITFQWS